MKDEIKRLKILVVDDSDLILSSLKSFFTGYDVEVITSPDGLDGIKKAAENLPDLIFLDLMMPDFDGIKMLQVKNVLRDIKDIPVVVISANTARGNVLAAIEAGANKVVSKPLNREIIIDSVREILGNDVLAGGKQEESAETRFADIRSGLLKVFVDNFPEKKRAIGTAIRNQDSDSLKNLVHEIKGAGGTIGYQSVSEISREIEERSLVSPSDWVFVEFKCNQLFKKVQEIEELLIKQSN